MPRTMFAETPLVHNLQNPEYMKILLRKTPRWLLLGNDATSRLPDQKNQNPHDHLMLVSIIGSY